VGVCFGFFGGFTVWGDDEVGVLGEWGLKWILKGV